MNGTATPSRGIPSRVPCMTSHAMAHTPPAPRVTPRTSSIPTNRASFSSINYGVSSHVPQSHGKVTGSGLPTPTKNYTVNIINNCNPAPTTCTAQNSTGSCGGRKSGVCPREKVLTAEVRLASLYVLLSHYGQPVILPMTSLIFLKEKPRCHL